LDLLRPGLLEGVTVRVCGSGPFGEHVAARFAALGSATVETTPDVLVWDASTPPMSVDDVRAALDDGWDVIHAVANGGMLERGGKIVLLAPAPGDAHAEAARAGLENLARTLSIEWARFNVRPVAIHPAGDGEPVAELCAYLASPAGDYFSGCVFSLSA
jgi:NAD(P)-dependent dehydrogenase (short-subunit alcohol dehydrogenase family)